MSSQSFQSIVAYIAIIILSNESFMTTVHLAHY